MRRAKDKPAVRIGDSLAYRVHRLARVLRVNLLEVASRAQVDLTPEQWFVLNKLRTKDGQSQVELGESIFADRPNMTRILQGMERKGLVRREVDPGDARRHQVFLTAAGTTGHDAMARHVPEERRRLLEGITQGEIDIVIRVLDQVERNALGGG